MVGPGHDVVTVRAGPDGSRMRYCEDPGGGRCGFAAEPTGLSSCGAGIAETENEEEVRRPVAESRQ